jgi:hypothetical protein
MTMFASNGMLVGSAADSAQVVTNTTNIINATSGYELTGGFTDRTSGQAGASDIGTDVVYTAQMVSEKTFLRFGFDTTQQQANDQPYFPTEVGHDTTKGLFGGSKLPEGVDNLFNFTDDTAYNQAVTNGGTLNYTAATGSYDMSDLNLNDSVQIRFDFNIRPQFGNTQVEVGLIWQTRDANDDATFTFFLAGQPIFLEEAGVTTLNRPLLTAYLASQEDINARALPAIRANGPVYCQPLTTLFTVVR